MTAMFAEQAGAYASAKGRQAGRYAATARIPTGNRQYQGVILAEFLIAVILVAALPIASGGSPNARAKGGVSPYDTGDITQLVAIGAVYFILAIVSSGNRGRFAAWFGGLVLLGIGFVKTAQIKDAATVLGGFGGGDFGGTGPPAGAGGGVGGDSFS